MEDLKEEVAAKDIIAVGSLNFREVSMGLGFPNLPLMNPAVVDGFKYARQAQPYTRVHCHSFGCNPTDIKEMWWLEYHFVFILHNCSFLYVGSNIEMDHHGR